MLLCTIYFCMCSLKPLSSFVSGSHFNPPFTIAIYLCGGMELMMVGPYLVSQLIGGVLGAGMAKVCSISSTTSKNILLVQVCVTEEVFICL